jgi:hypothetical protein
MNSKQEALKHIPGGKACKNCVIKNYRSIDYMFKNRLTKKEEKTVRANDLQFAKGVLTKKNG